MNWRSEIKSLAAIVAVFAVCFWLPVGGARFDNALLEAFHLARWYAREHVLLCLVPAFFIAGAIGVFIGQASVMKYLGPSANRVLAYSVASVSGTILAVCSCTILPLFASIYRMGAGLGPACAFLYSGPAINVLAIVLTARILGLELGIARAAGAVIFSIVIGLIMHMIFRKEREEETDSQLVLPDGGTVRPLWQNALYLGSMVAVLVFANWAAPNEYRFELKDGASFRAAVMSAPARGVSGGIYRVKNLDDSGPGREFDIPAELIAARTHVPGTWTFLWKHKWQLTSLFGVLFGIMLVAWFGVPWWKVAVGGAVTLVLAFTLPSRGEWILVPFATAIAALALILGTSGGELEEWLDTSWTFAKQIFPLLLGGVIIAGLLLGRVGHEGLIPSRWVVELVGGNSARANFFAAIVGAFMYFATLTEIPILQGLIGAGMGKGPALALLLAGPALSLPNMLVIRSIMGTKKTLTFVILVVIMATLTGMGYGFVSS